MFNLMRIVSESCQGDDTKQRGHGNCWFVLFRSLRNCDTQYPRMIRNIEADAEQSIAPNGVLGTDYDY